MDPRSAATIEFSRTLLDLIDRHATGALVLSDWRVLLRGGYVVGLQSPADSAGGTYSGPWLEGLSKAIAAHELSSSDDIVSFQEQQDDGARVTRVDALVLLLEALADTASEATVRRLMFDEMSTLVASEDKATRPALRWAFLERLDTRASVADLTARQPGIARRIAALLRAGLVSLATRAVSLPPPSSISDAPRRQSLPRMSINPLHPGAARIVTQPKEVDTKSSLAEARLLLDDPIHPLLLRIDDMEASDGPGDARAAAWTEVARLWRTRYGAVTEAARSLREASAADPSDPRVLHETALACLGVGQTDEALAYARNAAAAAQGRSREKALTQLAFVAMRRNDLRAATAALRSATLIESIRIETVVRLALMLEAAESWTEAAEYWRDAATRATAPAQSDAFRKRAAVLDDVESIVRAPSWSSLGYVDAATVCPWDPAAHLAALQNVTDTAKASELIALALDEPLHDPALYAEIERLLDTMQLRGDIEGALRITVRILDRVGPHVGDFRARAEKLAELATHAALRVAAYERILSTASATDKQEQLVRIAELHRNIGDRAAEARTWTRVLSANAHNVRALDRLVEIFSECGETRRLRVVLELRIEGAADVDARTHACFALADLEAASAHGADRVEAIGKAILAQDVRGSTIVRVMHLMTRVGRGAVGIEMAIGCIPLIGVDERGFVIEHAVRIAETALSHRSQSLSWIARILEADPNDGNALVTFERLAIETHAVDRAQATFNHLVERAAGPNTRRALHYRAARLFEAMNALRLALDSYAMAFAEVPSAGVILLALERVGALIDDLTPAIHALEILGTSLGASEARVRWLRRAAELAVFTSKTPSAGFSYLLKAWHLTARHEIESEMRAQLRTIADSQARLTIATPWLETMHQRAQDAWDDESKMTWLLRRMRVLAEGLQDAERAEQAWHELHAAMQSTPVSEAKRAEILREAINTLMDVAPDLASSISAPGAAESLEPVDQDQIDALLDKALAPTHDDAPTHTRVDPLDGAQDDEVPAPINTIPSEMQFSVPPATDDSLQDVLASEDPERAERLAARLVHDDARWPEAGVLVRASLRWAPHRLQALRILHAVAERQNARAELMMCNALLGLLDNAPVTQAIVPRIDDALMLAAFDDGRSRGVREAFRTVWEQSALLFRKSLTDYGSAPSERVAPAAQTPMSRAWQLSARAVGDTQTLLYKRSLGGDAVVIARTSPPSLVVHEEPGADERVLAFRIARALFLARSSNVLLATLSTDDARQLIAALWSAFGPHSAASTDDRATLKLSGQLWESIAPKSQQKIREAFNEHGEPLSYESLLRGIHQAAARAGLLAVGDPIIALRGLAAESSTDPFTPDAFDWSAFIARSSAAAAIVRFALSDEYIASIALRMSSVPPSA